MTQDGTNQPTEETWKTEPTKKENDEGQQNGVAIKSGPGNGVRLWQGNEGKSVSIYNIWVLCRRTANGRNCYNRISMGVGSKIILLYTKDYIVFLLKTNLPSKKERLMNWQWRVTECRTTRGRKRDKTGMVELCIKDNLHIVVTGNRVDKSGRMVIRRIRYKRHRQTLVWLHFIRTVSIYILKWMNF